MQSDLLLVTSPGPFQQRHTHRLSNSAGTVLTAPGANAAALPEQGEALADLRAALAVVRLPACGAGPNNAGDAAVQRLKRTADKVGAVLAYQVPPVLDRGELAKPDLSQHRIAGC